MLYHVHMTLKFANYIPDTLNQFIVMTLYNTQDWHMLLHVRCNLRLTECLPQMSSRTNRTGIELGSTVWESWTLATVPRQSTNILSSFLGNFLFNIVARWHKIAQKVTNYEKQGLM